MGMARVVRKDVEIGISNIKFYSLIQITNNETNDWVAKEITIIVKVNIYIHFHI